MSYIAFNIAKAAQKIYNELNIIDTILSDPIFNRQETLTD